MVGGRKWHVKACPCSRCLRLPGATSGVCEYPEQVWPLDIDPCTDDMRFVDQEAELLVRVFGGREMRSACVVT